MKNKVLDQALLHANAYLENLDQDQVRATTSYEVLRRRLAGLSEGQLESQSKDQLQGQLGGKLPQQGMDPKDVIDALVRDTQGGHLGSAGGRFFAWVVGGALDSALAAEWLTTTWDQNAALYACGPAAAVVEEIAGSWMKELLDLPAESSFAFTTGCQMAHFTCLAAARYAVLQNAGWDVHDRGLFGAPSVRVLVSASGHTSVSRALRFLGFGQSSITAVATNSEDPSKSDQIDPVAFETCLKSTNGPLIVVLNAADLNVAAFDPFEQLIPLAKKYGAWVHIDGAFGLIARASRSKRGPLNGVELADSWATDGHKWLNVPYDSGFACIRDRHAHRSSMSTQASYLESATEARDPMDWTPEWSRRARGFAIYCALRELGREGIENLIDRTCEHALRLVEGIGALEGAEILSKPTLNQGLIRFTDKRGADKGSANEIESYTDHIITKINATGEAFFSGTTWRGTRAMRVSVVNWRTTDADVDRAIAAVADVLKEKT